MAEEKKQVTEDEIAAGAVVNVADYLKGIDFPARREDVERCARENGADASALEQIRNLPEDRSYDNPVELFADLGEQVKRVVD